ncbi:MAG: MCE family protein [Methylotenera sp.]|nr:MCE family protein [Oligoflexia bacterium]
MNPSHASSSTRIRVGLFIILGLTLIGALTVFVNDKPFWWRPCELVSINVEDATGLKTKSPIRSLGLQIGYLKSVELTETHVKLGICITAPVEVLPSTRAYLRGEGFLGDKFVELKPVKYVGSQHVDKAPANGNFTPPAVAVPQETPLPPSAEGANQLKLEGIVIQTAWQATGQAACQKIWKSTARVLDLAFENLLPGAIAAPRQDSKEIPVGQKSQDIEKLVNQVDTLVVEMTHLTTNLKDSINPKEMRAAMQQLNVALLNASKTLSPEGNLNTTAQRSLGKLEDSLEQFRSIMTRINQGQGSLGMLLNDPAYADQIKLALHNLNKLLSKVGGVRFVVDVGAEQVPVYRGGRGFFRLGIWPEPDRYYLLGISLDPRGKLKVLNTTTSVAGGQSTTVETREVEEGGILLTAMLGKTFYRRIDVSAGSLHGDGAISVALNLGPHDKESMFIFRNDIYSRGRGIAVNDRMTLQVTPFAYDKVLSSLYVKGGIESVRRVETVDGRSSNFAWFYGAGITFDDEDIKILFTLR